MSKKLHILFLSSWYPSRISTYSGNFVQRHAEAIATKHKVTVIFSIGDSNLNQKYQITKEVINNVTTIIVYFKKNPFKIINGFRKYKSIRKGILLTENFDIIHGNILYPIGILVWLISKIFKKPYLFTEHSSLFINNYLQSTTFFDRLLLKFISKKAKFLVPVSRTLKNEMVKNGLYSEYKIIGNIVNTKLFYPKNNQQKIFTITHISNFDENSKNISGILNVIKKLSNIRRDFIFKIIGDGDTKEVQTQINALKIPVDNIILEGKKNPIEISQILQNSSLYISFSNYETFGIVLAEALACGIPVITTNTGMITELNPSSFIKIIKINDNEALLKNIIQFIDSKKSFDTNNMNDLIKKQFSIKNIANQYTALYSKIMNS